MVDGSLHRGLNGISVRLNSISRIQEWNLVLHSKTLGSVASIVGLILAVVFRIQDRKNHKMKESNRPSAKE